MASNNVKDSTKEAVQAMLEDDVIVPSGQALVVLSVVGPEEPQRCDQFAIKIRGVFATKAEADSHVRRLQKFDNDVHIYIADVGKWLVLPPKPEKIADQHYQDEFLDKMMTGYQKSQMEAKQIFERRKRDVMEKGLDANLLPEEKLPKPTAEAILETMQAQSTLNAPSTSKQADESQSAN